MPNVPGFPPLPPQVIAYLRWRQAQSEAGENRIGVMQGPQPWEPGQPQTFEEYTAENRPTRTRQPAARREFPESTPGGQLAKATSWYQNRMREANEAMGTAPPAPREDMPQYEDGVQQAGGRAELRPQPNILTRAINRLRGSETTERLTENPVVQGVGMATGISDTGEYGPLAWDMAPVASPLGAMASLVGRYGDDVAELVRLGSQAPDQFDTAVREIHERWRALEGVGAGRRTPREQAQYEQLSGTLRDALRHNFEEWGRPSPLGYQPFRSRLEQAVLDADIERGTPQEWMAALRSHPEGVSQSEISLRLSGALEEGATARVDRDLVSAKTRQLYDSARERVQGQLEGIRNNPNIPPENKAQAIAAKENQLAEMNPGDFTQQAEELVRQETGASTVTRDELLQELENNPLEIAVVQKTNDPVMRQMNPDIVTGEEAVRLAQRKTDLTQQRQVAENERVSLANRLDAEMRGGEEHFTTPSYRILQEISRENPGTVEEALNIASRMLRQAGRDAPFKLVTRNPDGTVDQVSTYTSRDAAARDLAWWRRSNPEVSSRMSMEFDPGGDPEMTPAMRETIQDWYQNDQIARGLAQEMNQISQQVNPEPSLYRSYTTDPSTGRTYTPDRGYAEEGYYLRQGAGPDFPQKGDMPIGKTHFFMDKNEIGVHRRTIDETAAGGGRSFLQEGQSDVGQVTTGAMRSGDPSRVKGSNEPFISTSYGWYPPMLRDQIHRAAVEGRPGFYTQPPDLVENVSGGTSKPRHIYEEGGAYSNVAREEAQRAGMEPFERAGLPGRGHSLDEYQIRERARERIHENPEMYDIPPEEDILADAVEELRQDDYLVDNIAESFWDNLYYAGWGGVADYPEALIRRISDDMSLRPDDLSRPQMSRQIGDFQEEVRNILRDHPGDEGVDMVYDQFGLDPEQTDELLSMNPTLESRSIADRWEDDVTHRLEQRAQDLVEDRRYDLEEDALWQAEQDVKAELAEIEGDASPPVSYDFPPEVRVEQALRGPFMMGLGGGLLGGAALTDQDMRERARGLFGVDRDQPGANPLSKWARGR